MKHQTHYDEFGLCPVCSNDPDILNVGRNHIAVCHAHKVFWLVGSNLFSGWRNDEPDTWKANKKLLATYRESTKSESTQPGRPPLGSLGDCLQEAASCQPLGYTRITGCTEAFWRDIPADRPDEPWFVMEAVTAAIAPAPVTIHIMAGTPAGTAREILKQVAKWLKLHASELEGLTPREPEPAAFDADSAPF